MKKEKDIHFTLLNKRPSMAEEIVRDVMAPVETAIEFVDNVKIYKKVSKEFKEAKKNGKEKTIEEILEIEPEENQPEM